MTLHRLRAMHAPGEKITMLTCYDASFARLLADAGVDVLLVGDSLGMVLQGHGQVLVLHDMLGITQGKLPRFVRNFVAGLSSVEVVRSALLRHESRGLHYSRDFPNPLPVSFPTVLTRPARSEAH